MKKKRKAKAKPKRKQRTYAQRISDMLDQSLRDIEQMKHMTECAMRSALCLRTAAAALRVGPTHGALAALLTHQATECDRYRTSARDEELPF